MTKDDFTQKLHDLLVAPVPEADERWASWADEWAGLNRNYIEDASEEEIRKDRFLLCLSILQTAEATMDALYRKFAQIHDLYGSEIVQKLYLQGIKSCLYDYELLGAAKYLKDGGDENMLTELSVERGYFDDDDPNVREETIRAAENGGTKL